MKDRTVVIEKAFRHPAETVWIGITDSRALAEWLMPNDFLPEVGHHFRFVVDSSGTFDGVTHCEVTEMIEQKKLVFTYKNSLMRNYTTTVEWTLRRAPGGTRLVIEHSGFEGFSGSRLSKSIGKTWMKMATELLPRVLENVRHDRFHSGAVSMKERAYKANRISVEGIEAGESE